MALLSSLTNTAVSLRYKEGVDSTGKDIIKAKKFSNVKISAVDQDIYDTAAALGTLMNYPVSQVVRTNDSVLINA